MVNIAFALLMSFIRCVVFMYLGIITILRLIKRKSEKIKKIFRISWITFGIILLLEIPYVLFVSGEFRYELRCEIVYFIETILRFLGLV